VTGNSLTRHPGQPPQGKEDELTRFFDHGLTFIHPVPLLTDGSTALIVTDMQYHDASADQGFTKALESMNPGSMSYYISRLEDRVIPAITSLLTAFRARGMPVVYLTLGSDFGDYRDLAPRFRGWMLDFEAATGVQGIFWADNPAFEIRKEVAPAAGDVVIRKRTFSAFNSSDFDPYLRYAGISNLVITGVTTNACIESTARDAADRGFGCVIVEDGTADYDEDAHHATLNAFHFNFGRVASAVQIIAALAQGHQI
jgi:biuret amidohydrolase